jgi:hypothetical protein
MRTLSGHSIWLELSITIGSDTALPGSATSGGLRMSGLVWTDLLGGVRESPADVIGVAEPSGRRRRLLTASASAMVRPHAIEAKSDARSLKVSTVDGRRHGHWSLSSLRTRGEAGCPELPAETLAPDR